MNIPVILEGAGLLAAFTHPSHLEQLSSWGFVQLPPTRIFNDFGYKRINHRPIIGGCMSPVLLWSPEDLRHYVR